MAHPAPALLPSAELPPDERERHWLAHVFVPDAPQLTVRAALTGAVLGMLLALSNLYVVLKTGWSLGVTITAAVLAFGFWTAASRLLPGVRAFGPLENNAMQSVASAAAYMTGGGTAAAIPALMMLTGRALPGVPMALWIGCLAFLGVFVAIPLKRQLVNVEQLPFPSGLASAETVRSLHAEGPEARFRSRALLVAALVGAAIALGREGLHLFPEHLAVFGAAAASYTLQAELSLIMVGAGALMGLRAALSQLLGGLVCYAVLAPWAVAIGAIPQPVGYKSIVTWSVWIGASMMLTAALLQFAFSWRSVGRAFADLAQVLRPGRARPDDPLAEVEVPSTWFAGGLAVLGPLAAGLAWLYFDIPPWLGLLAVLLSLVMAVVSARATGETDTTPSSAMGKLVQLVFGALHPGNIATNLMTAQCSAGIALHSSDLLTDLKSGFVLGARPRHQFFAQFLGVIAGTLAVVPAYRLLIPDASAIGDKFPAPAAQSWAAVAKLLSQGLGSVHPTARWGLLIGGLLGVALVLIERAWPRSRAFLPSPVAMGLAFTFPAWNSISMALGALAAWALERGRPALAALLVVPVASGLIAGESLLGVFINLWGAVAGR